MLSKPSTPCAAKVVPFAPLGPISGISNAAQGLTALRSRSHHAAVESENRRLEQDVAGSRADSAQLQQVGRRSR